MGQQGLVQDEQDNGQHQTHAEIEHGDGAGVGSDPLHIALADRLSHDDRRGGGHGTDDNLQILIEGHGHRVGRDGIRGVRAGQVTQNGCLHRYGDRPEKACQHDGNCHADKITGQLPAAGQKVLREELQPAVFHAHIEDDDGKLHDTGD